jgi:hypothetical protein
MVCPHGQADARFQRYQPKTFVSLLGHVRAARAYYHCRRCHQGHCPSDVLWRLNAADLTVAAQEVVSLAGLLTSFREASTKVLPKLAGLRLSESSTERTTEGSGQRLAALRAQGAVFGTARPWRWYTDALGRTCAYVSADATGVGQQGPGGAAAEGRMAYVAQVFNPPPEDSGLTATSRYLAGLYDLDELGAQARRQAAQVGMEQAQQWLLLTDGAPCLEAWAEVHFPKATRILDFYHAAEHLNDLARLRHANDPEQAKVLAGGWCHRLKHEGGAKLLGELEGLDLSGWSSQAREKHRLVSNYVRANAYRMDYPEYRKNGWLIGSGHIEAACKTVIGARLKQSGMRWSETGTDGVCQLRALFKSEAGQWEAFWAMAV